MKFYFAFLITASLIPFCALAQKKEIVELGRDVSLLQDQIRSLQRSQDEKMAALTVLLQQALDAANKANTAVAVLQNALNDRLGEQQKSVGGTVAGVGNKVDQMAEEFRGLREAINDLNTRMGKFDAKLTDISNAVRTITTPSAPPTSTGGGSAPGGPLPSADDLYNNAFRDMMGGKTDLAMQEFQDYLKYFHQTDRAPNAQFYIGDLYLRAGDTDNAIKSFDAVLEQYSENNKTPDAHYMKARALFQAGQKTAAAKEYCEVVRRYPASDFATKSKTALRGMGLSPGCGVSAGAPTGKRRAR